MDGVFRNYPPDVRELRLGTATTARGGDVLEPIRRTVNGQASTGSGESFRLRVGWPKVAQLDYVQKFTTAALLLIGLLLLLGYALKSPRGAVQLLAGAARRRVGA